jgi:PadR family transcriptional regulator, regulatory protein PadR
VKRDNHPDFCKARDLMILRTPGILGPQHAYGIARRLQQVSEDSMNLKQGIIIRLPSGLSDAARPWLLRQDGKQSRSEAKYYTITRVGLNALNEETAGWRQMVGV